MRGEAAVVLMLLLAGCVGVANDEPFPDTISTPAGRTVIPDDPDCDCPSARAEAPLLREGQAWTYEGKEFYNPDTSFTVVVAVAAPNGYLFAGGVEDDIVYHALWQSRWYGERDLQLQRAEGGGALRFPLTDGASWDLEEGLTLTARAGEVDTPRGKLPGFLIDGVNERMSLHLEYAPAIGNVVKFHREAADGTVWDDLRMTRVAEDQPWVWFELGDLHVVPNAHEPAVFEVTEGFDALIASAGGTSGARAFLQGPDGASSWSAEFAGAEEWHHAMLPATAGRWEGAIAGRPFVEGAPDLPAESPVGWAYMHVAPVKWLRNPR